MSKYLDIKTAKFLLVGVINTIVGTTVMFVLYNVLSASYWFSSAMNYIVGSIVSYFLNKYFTFQYKKRDLKVVVKFIVNISVCYLLSYGAAKEAVYFILQDFSVNVKDNLSMLAGMCLFVVLNYLGQRLWVFQDKEREP